MRQRRSHKCRKLFEPEKHFYFYYSGDCRVADVGPHYEHDYRGYQRERAIPYDHGWNDAWRSRPPPPLKGLAMDDFLSEEEVWQRFAGKWATSNW